MHIVSFTLFASTHGDRSDKSGDMSVEGFTCLLVFKNLFSFGLTFKGFDWLVSAGNIKDVFVTVGSVQVAICALTIPMCKFCLPYISHPC